ncbi:MAG: caspase family protein, partial [Fibrobacterota bacterium]
MNALLMAMALWASAPAPDAAVRPMRRFLLATASNDGGVGKARLRYSTDDAQGVVSVMKSLGGVSDATLRVLTEPDTGRFLSTLDEMTERMVAARDSGFRVEFMLYYSGHSDEEGLLLGASRLRYSRLRRMFETSPAEIRLAVLDACASGAALRAKGGVRKQAFRIEGAERLRGQAFLTSSRAEEVSQESDKLKGSFFTQAFVAGLRGAADADADSRVTLLEAYRYAYGETVEKTSSTRNGPQHPEFDLDLSGSGDVVLADLSQSPATLEFPTDIGGRLEISDPEGVVAADLEKAVGRKLSIGLPPGTWRVASIDSSRKRIGRAELLPGGRHLFAWSPMDSIVAIEPVVTTKSATVRLDTPSVHIPVNFGFVPPYSLNRDLGLRVVNNFSLDVFMGEAARIDGIQISGGFANATKSVNGWQIAGGVARTGDLRGTQIAMATLADGTMAGSQYGIGAVAAKGGYGFQAGVATWLGGDFTGYQSAVVGVATGNVNGLQSTVVGWAGGVRGAQLAVVNIAGSVTGVQAGVVNLARSVRGTQMGVVNLAAMAKGAQIGVLNLADTLRGAVIGVVNLARDLDGFPLGVVSLGLNMRPGVDAWMEESGWTTAALRFDAARFHVKYAATFSVTDPVHRFGGGLGLGAHWNVDSIWRIDADLSTRQILNLPGQGRMRMGQWNQVSVSVHRRIGSVGCFAGISYNALVLDRSSDANHLVNLPGAYQLDAGDAVRLWPGMFAGIG